MLDPQVLKDTLNEVFTTEGMDYADLYIELSRTTSIQIEDGKVEKVLQGGDSGGGLRALSGGKTSYAYTNALDEKALSGMASELKSAVKSGYAASIDLRRKEPRVDFPIRTDPAGVSLDRKVAIMKEAERAARGYDKSIRQVSVTYRELHQRVQIASSDGFLAEDERLQTIFLVNVVAESGGVVQTGYEPVGGFLGFELFDEISAPELARKAARKAVMMLKARRAPGGRRPVVISSEAGGTMIHEAIGHGLEADLANQGLSVYSGKLGRKIAADIVTVLDDATLPGKRGSFRFDDEGVPSQKTVLVLNGVLQSFMYDRLQAMKAGSESTGNGRRQSYRHRPIPRMTNTLIAPGKTAPEEILKGTPQGLFVKKMGGGQVNTLTGDFVFDVQEGYLIENGQLGEPVRGATLAGNGPRVLMEIDMVGSDLGFSIGTCGKDAQGVPVSDAQPTIRVPELVVGGAS
ncbi:MAG: TldD/PmbA family protein [Nitrospiraceae bacterium]|nr:TldD/PmbA family protein [Nitrospiraceae bacterium]